MMPMISHLGVDEEHHETRQELSEHLGELRTRLIRSVFYVVLGMVVMYNLFDPIYAFAVAPLTSGLAEIAKHYPPEQRAFVGRMVFHSFAGPFFLRLQLSIIAGLIVAIPLITLEAWGFVMPALTYSEKRIVRFIAPMSVVLFLLGAGLAYAIMPSAVHWFLLYLADFPGSVLLQDPTEYILFLVKMVVAFGLVFQLPVVMMGLGKVGIIRASMLIKYWRYIVVGITVAAMVITPSNDPISMIVMAVPMILLFFGSIGLVRMVEPSSPEIMT